MRLGRNAAMVAFKTRPLCEMVGDVECCWRRCGVFIVNEADYVPCSQSVAVRRLAKVADVVGVAFAWPARHERARYYVPIWPFEDFESDTLCTITFPDRRSQCPKI